MTHTSHARTSRVPPMEQVATMNRTLKRLVVATFASAVAVLPLSMPAQADTGAKPAATKVVKGDSTGGATTQRAIDWE